MYALDLKLDNPNPTNGFSKLATKTAHFAQAHIASRSEHAQQGIQGTREEHEGR